MGRLTDKRIAELSVFGGNIATSRESAAELREMAQEIRERRAQDLSDEDIEGLEFARWRLVEYAPESGSYVVRTKRALAALSKLTRGNR